MMDIKASKDNLKYLEKIAVKQKEELERLSNLVDEFAVAMKAKLHTKAKQGYSGWDVKCYQPKIIDMLFDHVRRLDRGDKSQAVDIANLASFIWNLDDWR